MPSPKRLTTAWLRKREVSEHQVAIFAAEWPDGAELTAATLRRAASLGLNIYWLGRLLLAPQARDVFEGASIVAQHTFQEADATALRAFREARATDATWLPLIEALDAAWLTYLAAGAPILIDALGLKEE